MFRAGGIFLIILLFAFVKNANATHIVGGELNYESLGNDSYKIILKLYKDCGISVVPFDDPAGIYLYANNQVIDTLQLPIVLRDTLDATFEDSCLVVPPDICVDFARYEGIFTLPATPSGYTLAYIRCCRNSTIVNAQGIDEFGNPVPPDLIGATYTSVIPGTSIVSVNSNPEFNELPPIIICSGQNISVDQSAFDKDGDQLVYSLCTPNVGGSLQQVFGNPIIEVPPFIQVDWIPPYGIGNVMGGDIPLNIDPTSGLLTGKAPDMVGQFVVGVCVQEFRGGVLLSENKRDFQFNIADCAKVFESDYEIVNEPALDTVDLVLMDTVISYSLLCDTNLVVQFDNVEGNAEISAWDFGDGSDISFEENPTHIFPDTGFYIVTLIAQPGSQCTDTFVHLVNLQYQEILANFENGRPECYDPERGLQFEDVTEDASQVVSWEWDFGDNQTSIEQNPIHLYDEDGEYEVTLVVHAANGCRSSIKTTVNVISLEEFSLEDTIALCNSDSINLPLEIDGSHTFIWSPTASLDNPFAQQPNAFPSANTDYTVQILTTRANGNDCIQTADITVLTDIPVPAIENVTDSIQCDSVVELAVNLSDANDVIWSSDNEFSTILSDQPSFEVNQSEESIWYFVEASNQFCNTIDSVLVIQKAVYLILEDKAICIGDDAELSAEVVSNDNNISYQWMFGPNVINTLTPDVTLFPDSTVAVMLEATNSFGCKTTELIEVIVNELPAIEASANTIEVVNSQDVQLTSTVSNTYDYSWQPEEILNESTISNPMASVNETTTFIVTVQDENGCENKDTITITVTDQLCSDANIFIPTAFSPNNDGLNDIFRIQGDVIEKLVLNVYDRWGNIVFETNDISIPWDGTKDGNVLASDVYGYSLVINCFGGEQFNKSGSITLTR